MPSSVALWLEDASVTYTGTQGGGELFTFSCADLKCSHLTDHTQENMAVQIVLHNESCSVNVAVQIIPSRIWHLNRL